MTLNCWCERESFHVIGLTLWKSCMKEIFHQRSHFIQSWMTVISQTKTLNMHWRCGNVSRWQRSENIMICISRQTFFCLQMFLKISEMFAWRTKNWIQHGITPRLGWFGMLVWKRRGFNLNCFLIRICFWWLSKAFVVESQWFQSDMQKPTINIWVRNSIRMKNQNSSNILTLTFSMVGRWVCHCLWEVSSGWQICKIGENFLIKRGEDVFLKLPWNTQRSFMTCTMNIHSL